MKEEFPLSAAEETKARRVAYLVTGFLRQSLSEKELDELDGWIAESDANQELFEELTDPDVIEAAVKKQEGIDTEKALQKIKEQMAVRPTARLKARKIWGYAIAASLLFLIGLYFLMEKDNLNKQGNSEIVSNDVQPGGHKALLTLADGKTIDLTSQKNGQVTNQDGVVITKATGDELIYSPDSAINGMRYNILNTPRGGTYRLVLADGSIVWLNAASSLKYPVAFNAENRQVELTGEAFFEVAKNNKQPFVVTLPNGNRVEVLGTKFNINAYEDEATITTTLIEGSVKVSSQLKNILLEPGEQAGTSTTGNISVEKNFSINTATGWKEGKFVFKDATIESIMRQVARWYDVNIQYEGKSEYHFNATLSRNLPVSKLFQLLEKTGNVHFTIKGNTIIVRP